MISEVNRGENIVSPLLLLMKAERKQQPVISDRDIVITLFNYHSSKLGVSHICPALSSSVI